jgi:hypothetical protein
VRPPTINATVTALRFFFSVTVDRPNATKLLTFVAEQRKIPVVLTAAEVVRFWRPRRGRSTRRRSAPPMARACACRRLQR